MQEALKETKPTFVNHVKKVYENFKVDEISAKVAELVKPVCLKGVTDVEIIFQSIENLHEACLTTQGIGTFPVIIQHQVDIELCTRHF